LVREVDGEGGGRFSMPLRLRGCRIEVLICNEGWRQVINEKKEEKRREESTGKI